MIRPPIPKSVHRRRGNFHSPFPLTIGTSTACEQQLEPETVYRGRLHGNSVHIDDPDEARNLYSMGFFGKGMFSRSAPVYDAITNMRSTTSHTKQDEQFDEKLYSIESSSKVPDDINDDRIRTSDDIAMVTDGDTESADKFVMRDHQDQLSEPLIISLVEAFFLSYGLGCLLVYEASGENPDVLQARVPNPYNLEELWHRFCQSDADFVSNYVAYHHFRSKGWVPRSGMKFGTDFVLYKEGPQFYHASYSVLVRSVRDRVEDSKEISWAALAGLNRITEQAAKELLLCHVLWPRDVDIATPNCLSQFKVKETLVKRWVSNEERAESIPNN